MVTKSKTERNNVKLYSILVVLSMVVCALSLWMQVIG